jgi:IclR family transcriptional regulator, pca regulon regulatory protein
LSRSCSNSWNVKAEQRIAPRYSQSLERGLAILSAFRSGRPLLGVSELSREIGLGRSTAHRYVATLAELGYLQQDAATKKYRLGPRVLDLGFSAIHSMELREISAPHLRQLSDDTGFTVNMAILDGTDIVYIDRFRSSRAGQREIDLNLHVGSRLPAYCTSMGKVLLAYLPPAERDELLARSELLQRGPNTLTVRRSLAAELQRVREHGLALNNEELAYGLRSIAAPVFSQSGEIAAAINLAVHSSMVSMEELVARLGCPLRRASAEISARIGYRPDGH